MNQAARIGFALASVPVELLRRIIGWPYTVRGSYMFKCPYTARTLTVHDRMKYDSFTLAPNLRRADGGPSRAAQAHDVAWQSGRWDDGEMMTFDEANEMFLLILVREDHPAKIVDWYYDGVSLGLMRRRWRKKFGHE